MSCLWHPWCCKAVHGQCMAQRCLSGRHFREGQAACPQACYSEFYHTIYVNRRQHATAHLAVISTEAKPAHPVAALDVAAWVEEVCGLNPVLGVHLQAVKCYQDRAHVHAYSMHARLSVLLGPRQASRASSEMCIAGVQQILTWPSSQL
jgi:hypothetical protein